MDLELTLMLLIMVDRHPYFQQQGKAKFRLLKH